MSDWLAAIGLISTATVSILSIYLPHHDEKQHREQDRADGEAKRIDKATLDFLGELSNFRHWTLESLAHIAGPDRAVEHLYTDLQVAQYAWEQAVWPRLGAEHRAQVKAIRTRLQRVHTHSDLSRGPGNSEVPDLADKVLAIARVDNRRS